MPEQRVISFFVFSSCLFECLVAVCVCVVLYCNQELDSKFQVYNPNSETVGTFFE